jgi:pyruvate dehydrogenase E2 component (dihydrolipoamide acetyltransferase)
MSVEITMPQLSDTMTEGTVVKWHKKEGDPVKSGEEVADIETDKATMPMEAFEGGTLAVILAPEGQKVRVGQAIGVIATAGEKVNQIKARYSLGVRPTGASAAASPPAKAPADSRQAPAPAAAKPATLEATATSEVHEPDDAGHGATPQTAVAAPPVSHAGDGNRPVRISPLARRIATEMGIDPKTLRGSGPDGRITKQDVVAPAPAAATRPAAQPQLAPGQKQVIPLTKMRAAIAKGLTSSKQGIPHYYETIEVDVEDLSRAREKLNEMLEPQKIRLSLADFVAKAVATALVHHPELNATFNGAEITRYGDVNLGMAVAVADGLIVPVLRGIQKLGLKEIRKRSTDLAERARAGRLKQEEMTGGTFTISSLGPWGVRDFSAIINPPEVAILAVGVAEKRAVVRHDQIVARTMMNLTLSSDHRVVDGAVAAEFLRTLKTFLEEPSVMFFLNEPG